MNAAAAIRWKASTVMMLLFYSRRCIPARNDGLFGAGIIYRMILKTTKGIMKHESSFMTAESHVHTGIRIVICNPNIRSVNKRELR